MTDRKTETREQEIRRTLRHALGTRPTETDSWLNGYQEDVQWLLLEIDRLRAAADASTRDERA